MMFLMSKVSLITKPSINVRYTAKYGTSQQRIIFVEFKLELFHYTYTVKHTSRCKAKCHIAPFIHL